MESVEELKAKIRTYEEQLHQLNAMLISDPANENFQNLRNDLMKVITLTTDLISFQSDNIDSGYVENSTAREGVGLVVGDKVEVSSGERPYAAVILSINQNTSECKVKYYEYEDEVSLSISDLKKLPSGHFDIGAVNPPGFKCQCKYGSDQRWYDCTVDAVTELGFMVTYTQYGVSEEVPLEYLRPSADKSQREKERDKFKDKADSNGLIPIPESLKILPTDTEEEKNRKKKKLKAIKSQNRIKMQEVEVSSTQKTWQSFVGKKSVKRAAPGSIKEQSMFASPEEVEGKVGVTRSGLGMTEFERRKRHNFGPLGGK